MDAYSEAHLFVAAIRVLQHRKNCPPALEEVCELINVSVELGNTIRRKLSTAGIVNSLEDPFGVKLMVGDHLAIESLPKEAPAEDGLARELAEFQAKKKNSDEKVAALQAEIEKKKKDLFADLEAKLKKEMNKKS
jgi:hypothetical protein